MIQRQTAKKCSISHILSSKFVSSASDSEPDYFETEIGNVSRVNLMAVVIEKLSNTELFIDDGTGMIMIRCFNENIMPADISPGAHVLVIGILREFNNEKYITCEIIKRISPEWLSVRRKELGLARKPEEKPAKPAGPEEKHEKTLKPDYDKIVKTIKELDNGKGVLIDDVAAALKDPDIEKKINKLIEAGEIFPIGSDRVQSLF